ncbi:NB-ARC domain-containing protein [Streptomyces sp. P9(2023)]|uniref:NB-ARC domain-containing protein n=1 Tax=Streptomyces sp. P9(2023) TaxID=3064394 RepID=UPI0028F45556|nr:NB-ARC domain-containing protein [Streptomyces sp. P9(2023)]MDT9687788.1 NB-ARC domain-containing protein [Streptomyces sp. P9(2023)]
MTEETRNSVGGQARVETLVQAGRIEHLHLNPPALSTAYTLMADQLPPECRSFVNRDEERSRLAEALAQEGATPALRRPFVAVISGVGGVGKTTLGTRLARGLRADHPEYEGNVRYVDLDDHRTDGGADLSEAYAELLRGFGLRPDELERTLAARRNQYRALTQHRRMILVLDNARTGAEVEALLPASGGSVVLAIGRRALYEIPGGADLELPLAPLAAPHSHTLLRTIVRDDPRLIEEPDAAAELARLCQGLPAALEVAARWVRRHGSRPLGRLADRLAREWKENGVPEVEAVWNAAYEDLSPRAARLYRLLAVHPGPYVAPDAVVALHGPAGDGTEEAPETAETGEAAEAAYDALDELTASGLLPAAGHGELHRMHDLLRDHAARRARRDDPDGTEAAAGRARVVRWYLRQAQRADLLGAGPRLTVAEPAPALPGVPDVEWTGDRGGSDALRWLEARRHALFGAVRDAYRHGLDAEAWALCEPLWTHFLDHQHYADVIDAFTTGRDAARRAEHTAALVRMRCQLARPLWELGELDQAAAEVDAAVTAADTLGGGSDLDRTLRASAREFRGKVATMRGDWAGSIPDFLAARRLHEEIPNPYGAMLQTYLLARSYRESGEWDTALAHAEQAHAAADGLKRARMTARTGLERGRALHALGRREEAAPLYEAALSSARERHAAREETEILELIAALAAESDDT